MRSSVPLGMHGSPSGYGPLDVRALIAANTLDHEWLSEEFAEESRRQAVGVRTWRQHFIPVFYLSRWAVDGLVQPVELDSAYPKKPQPPKAVGFARDLYTLPGTVDVPQRWVEVHLSRIEGPCAKHIEALVDGPLGSVTDRSIKADLAVYLGFQVKRTVAARHRTRAIVDAPDSAKRKHFRAFEPSATDEQIEQSMRDQRSDPVDEAIRVMLADVRNVAAGSLFKRRWAVCRTTGPLVTCDEPVVMIAGPRHSRAFNAGSAVSAVVVLPLAPDRVLVMLRNDLRFREQFVLNRSETSELNQEILAATEKTAFERPGDTVIEALNVPRRDLSELDYSGLADDEAFEHMLAHATHRSRWKGKEYPPRWPVLRWYR